MDTGQSVLAIDLGKTGCRAVLWESGRDAVRAQGDGAPGLAFAGGIPQAMAAITAVAAPLLTALPSQDRPVLVAGVAGALTAPHAAVALAHHLAAALPVRAAGVTSDAVAAHAGALDGAAGLVLAIGTGAVVTAMRTDGLLHRVDGWGPALGDEGSGAAIGQAGLRAALRAFDGRGPATALRAAAQRRFGPPADIVARVGTDPNPARLMAGFAPDVAQAADGGDTVAGRILQDAVMSLTDAVRAGLHHLAAGLSPVPAAVIGGLLHLGPALTLPLFAALRGLDGLALRDAAGSSLDGARLLATRAPGPHAPLVSWSTG